MDFKLYTNALKAYTAENGDLHVRGTTSSTIVDMHGDEMTLAALKSMEETAKQNMTVFLNHNYNVPDDLFGSVTDARIVKRYDTELGQEVYDLDIDVRVVGEDENPLAMKTYRAIKRGVKLGLSIGARVEKVAKRKGAEGKETYVIDSVRLLESSVVGIPANQRSYLQSALKSLRSDVAHHAAAEDMDLVKAVEIEGEPAPERAALIASLQDLLADTTAFYLKAHGAHWNVIGEEFQQYHELFGEIYEDVQNAIDPTAELLRKLNAPALADINEIASRAQGEPVADDNDPESLAEAVYAANETVLDCIGRAIAESAKLNQQGILNFLAERQDMHQKWSWQLRASLAPEEVEPEPAETPEAPGDMPEVEDSLKAASKVEMGNYVSWKQVDGADGVGEVEQVVEDGVVTIPPGKETVAAAAGDPAVLVRVWVPQPDGSHKPSNDFVGLNASQLKVVPDLEMAGKKKPDATTVPGLEITNPEEEKKSMEDLEQKKTRVTVTVSTDGEVAAPAVAPAANEPAVETDSAEAQPEEVIASAAEPCSCPEGECGCEAAPVEGIVEKAVEEPKAPVAPAPKEESESVKQDEPVKVQSEDNSELSPRNKSVAPQVIDGINGILADLSEEDRNAVLSAIGVQKDANVEAEVAPISESDAAVEAAEDVVAETAPQAVEADPAVDAAAISLEEVAAIAKSALDAAIAAQQEVVAVKSAMTELVADKAIVEGELAKAMDLVGRLVNIPMGRKHVAVETSKSTNGEKAPWLDPFIARLLDAQE